MADPVAARPSLKRFVGDSDPRSQVVHDIHTESANCRLHEIFRDTKAVVFSPDGLEQAHAEGYKDCEWCIGKIGP